MANKTHQYHQMRNGKTVQLLQVDTNFFVFTFDSNGCEPQILTAENFTNLTDASLHVAQIIHQAAGLKMKREQWAAPNCPYSAPI